MKKITKRQNELIKFCGYKIKNNRLIGENESLSSIFFDKKTGLFSIDIKSHTFSPGDYDSIEYFTITLNRMLGLIYELNNLEVQKNEE